MKKNILPLVLTILALVPLKTLAKVYMIVTATNETVTVFELAERPALVFSDYEMHVYCADRELTFDRRDVADVTFSDEKPDIPEPPTGITSFPAADDVRGIWQTDGSHILFRSLPAYAPVGVYSIDGQLLAGTHADHDGQAALDMSLWTKGMVIVRAGSMAVKVDCSKCGHRTSASSHLRTFENKSRPSLLAPRSSNNSFRTDGADAPTDSLYINKGATFHVYNVDGIERILFQQEGNTDSLWVVAHPAPLAPDFTVTHSFPWERIDSITLYRPEFSPYTPAPTIYADEPFTTGFGNFTVETTKGLPWIIDFNTAKATGYVSGSTTPSESYLLSQPLDMSRAKQVEISFDYILRYVRAGAVNRVLVTDYYTGEPATTDWTDITGKLTQGSNWDDFYEWKTTLPDRFLGESAVVFALYYSCTTNSATWEVKNLLIREIYEEVIPSTNLNKNPTVDAPYAWRLEYPHIKDDADNLVVVKRTDEFGITYSLEWDCTKKAQRWTCYQFHNGIPDNNVGRTQDSWYDDPDIPKAYQTHYADYTGSGYSRGHMCMSDDRQSSVDQNAQTFYMSNAHPQHQAHNGGLWQTLENKVNSWGNSSAFRDTLYVVKAGTIDHEEDILGYTNSTKTQAHLLIPKYFYMAVLCLRDGQYHALAFWTEHTSQSITKAKPKDYAITVRELEEKTGIDFFCNLPDDIEAEVEEAEIDLKFWGIQ